MRVSCLKGGSFRWFARLYGDVSQREKKNKKMTAATNAEGRSESSVAPAQPEGKPREEEGEEARQEEEKEEIRSRRQTRLQRRKEEYIKC